MVSADKSRLVASWRRELEQRLDSLDSSQSAARAGTRVDGSHRPENRGERAAVTTQGCLAHGLQQRMDSLAEQLRLVNEMGCDAREEVVVGAWLELELESGECRHVAIFPGGDATCIEWDGRSVQILSPSSPLVQPLLGLEEGDGAELRALGSVELRRIR